MKTPKVLLVDDSPIIRAVVVHALSGAGIDVTTIDGPRALASALAAARPDLLLVDATYPDVTDEELVSTIAQYVTLYPVVLFSDRKDAEVASLVSRSGAAGSVPKEGALLAERLRPFLTRV